jgi:hypothetical protein
MAHSKLYDLERNSVERATELYTSWLADCRRSGAAMSQRHDDLSDTYSGAF